VLTKFSRHPVWSNVIAGLIVAGILAVAASTLNWWPTILRAVTAAYYFLGARTPVVNWLLGLLILIALMFVGVIVAIAIAPASRPPTPSVQDYTKDTFENLVWRWRYNVHGGIYDLTSFCPHCDFQVYPKRSPYLAGSQSVYNCASCGRWLGVFNEPVDDLHDRVARLIEQKIRNGTWANSGSASPG
jgi:hypothetical protein